jgi:hypothetical protein
MRERQEIVDQLCHVPGRMTHLLKVSLSVGVECAGVFFFEDDLGESIDGGKRSTQVVGNRITERLQLLVGDFDGILILRLQKSLEASDFTSLATLVDDYLDQGRKLRGVLISGKSFPGWEDLDGLIAHLKFVRNHHSMIDKVAIVADGVVAYLVPSIASHFLHARLQHFDDEAAALAWLELPLVQSSQSQGKESIS